MRQASVRNTLNYFNADAIFDAGVAELDAARFTDAPMRQRFSDLIKMFNDFGGIEDAYFPDALAQIEHVLRMRLKLALDEEIYPEILEEKITRPFFVIGNARAGTTFAQTILALDEGHRTPRYWDVRHPSPPPGMDEASDAAAIADEADYVRYILKTSPRMLVAHPYFEQGPYTEAEDEYLHAFDFHTPYPLPYLKIPSLPQGTTPVDGVAAMKFHKRMLQHLQFKRPTRRWVGKGVVHQYMLPALLEVYPDAVCFWMHRAPDQYIPSLLELLDAQYHPFNRDLYNVVPEALVDQLRLGVDHILAAPSTSDPRVHHIKFHDFVRNPAPILEDIYKKSGIPFTPHYAAALSRQMSDPEKKADRYGKFDYDAAKYGLSAEKLRLKFQDYCVRFGV